MDNIGAVITSFYNVARFPHVIGIVNGFVIKIDAPFVCGPTAIFYYLSAKWPGSVHDSRVLRNSSLYRTIKVENIFQNGVILGDSAYPLRSWLMTLLHCEPENPAERKYNARLKTTWQIIERALGILKEKFPCLNYLRLNPVHACEVVKCCTTLCNFGRSGAEEVFESDVEGMDWGVVIEDEEEEPIPMAARERQEQIVNSML
nr:putative nuclease HARBI1 [Halyomorpha halys]